MRPTIIGRVPYRGRVDVHIKGDLAIQLAAQRGYLSIVKFLVKRGADIHVSNSFGAESPLRGAIIGGHLDVVKYLVEKGANIHVHNDWPFDLAEEYNQSDVAKYLKSLM